MNKVISVIQWLGIFIAWVLILVGGFWLFYPYKIAEFKNLPFPIVNEGKVIKRGDRVRYRIDYCKYTNAMPHVTKYFVDGVLFELPQVPSLVTKGCGSLISDAYIPKAIPEGNYTIKTVTEYKVNPIRKITIINYTEPFTVK